MHRTFNENIIGGVPSASPYITSGIGVYEVPMGEWGIMESFVADLTLKEFPSKIPSPSVPPWK